MYDENWFGSDTAETTKYLGVWVGVIFALLAMVPAIFIKSESTGDAENLSPLSMKTIGGSLKQISENFKEALKWRLLENYVFQLF